ncbi:MAG: ATP-dependent helicase, partial [Saprospiraceae bacterium]|nr:ATP-dependent helicase [Saprospiraceae bacterium]
MSQAYLIREKRSEAFAEIVTNLNPDQRTAVEQIDGPMLVVAGPGTGKTHMLAARIGSILKNAGVGANNVLCLTFTNAGVSAMRNRLLQFIGPEAHKIHINTFHSFCDGVIRDHPEKFGHQDLEPTGDLEQLRLIESILKELPYENILVKGYQDPTFYTPGLRDLFSKIKQEGWTLQEMEEAISKWEKQIPFEEEYLYKRDTKNAKKGDLKYEGKKELDRMAKLRAGINCYPVYLEKMKKAKRYEYADMINWVVKGFRTDDQLLGLYQEQFQYILVDEYQDTNGSQHDLLTELTSFWEAPNLFVVGDDDQSIYEFQGARLENIKDFYQDHEKVMDMVVLKDNYRSSKRILDAAKSFIEKNQQRLINILPGITKDLNPALEDRRDYPQDPKVFTYDNPIQEIADVVNQIEKLRDQGVSLQEIAVIYPKNKHAEDIQELLLKREIPFQVSRPLNILDQPIVQQIEKLLFYLDTELPNPASGDYELFWIMHFPCWELGRKDLAKMAVYRSSFPREERPSIFSLFNKTEEELTEIGIQDPESLLQFYSVLEDLIKSVVQLPLMSLIEKVLEESGLLRNALKDAGGFRTLQVIQTFKSFVQQEVRRDPTMNIDKLLTLLDDHRKNNLSIALQQYAEGGDKVFLTTAHSAKGLEFDHVF